MVLHLGVEAQAGRDDDGRARHVRAIRLARDPDGVGLRGGQPFELEQKTMAAVAEAGLFQVLAIGVGEHARDHFAIDRHLQAHRGRRLSLVAHPPLHAVPVCPFDVAMEAHFYQIISQTVLAHTVVADRA